MARIGLCLYGLIRTTEEVEFDLVGIEHMGTRGAVRTVVFDGIGAVVSACPVKDEILPTRRNLDTHSKVIREVMAKHTVIPIAFGHVVKSAAEIGRVIQKNRKAIMTELDRLDNKVEMSLRVQWDVENIFNYFLEADPALAAARDQTFNKARPPTRMEKMELGQMFEESINRERQRYTDQVVEVFRGCSAEVKVNAPATEKTVMDLVVLVDRLTVPSFEQKVYEVAEAFPAQFSFDYNGPWAPFNFVDVDLQPSRHA